MNLQKSLPKNHTPKITLHNKTKSQTKNLKSTQDKCFIF
ncbi:hypothetical protein HC081234_21600 [Helicobacter cinaedi]|nr:hypothetical protein HC081234_21600 [Helicobacter cinaedi]